MSGNTSNLNRTAKEEETVPYPNGVPRWDEETTVLVDPVEMQLVVQAMMSIDSGAVALPDRDVA